MAQSIQLIKQPRSIYSNEKVCVLLPTNLICLQLRNDVSVCQERLCYLVIQNQLKLARYQSLYLGKTTLNHNGPQNVKSKQLYGQRLAIVFGDLIMQL